jgi:hypothetical protein
MNKYILWFIISLLASLTILAAALTIPGTQWWIAFWPAPTVAWTFWFDVIRNKR